MVYSPCADNGGVVLILAPTDTRRLFADDAFAVSSGTVGGSAVPRDTRRFFDGGGFAAPRESTLGAVGGSKASPGVCRGSSLSSAKSNAGIDDNENGGGELDGDTEPGSLGDKLPRGSGENGSTRVVVIVVGLECGDGSQSENDSRNSRLFSFCIKLRSFVAMASVVIDAEEERCERRATECDDAKSTTASCLSVTSVFTGFSLGSGVCDCGALCVRSDD